VPIRLRPSWLDVLEEMAHLYIKVLNARERGDRRERLRVYKEVKEYLKKYVTPFCNGLFVRMARDGEFGDDWWAGQVLITCKQVNEALTNKVEHCTGRHGEDFEECVGSYAVLAFDRFKYVLHSNPLGRWNLVVTFPISTPHYSDEELRKLAKIVMGGKGIPSKYEDIYNSAQEVFDVITAMRRDPYLALDVIFKIRRQLKDPRFRWHKLY